ncbi:hypothetical protein DVH03_06120 [Lactiplantibacillus plantarum]|nr:hypothetical protein DVH03_06120 [Lactiplantibacillus plantarum]
MMVEKVKNRIKTFWDKWLCAALFVSGVILLCVTGFLISLTFGCGLLGLLLIVMACVLNYEEQKGGER